MVRSLGQSKSVFYFDVCGEVNTEKALELAVMRARELGVKKLIVASETGLSALKAVEALKNTGIALVVVTSAAGTEVEKTAIGDLQIGIPDRAIWDKLEKIGARIIRGADPLYSVGAALEQMGTLTLATIIRLCLKIVSSGTSVCISAALMATDNGLVEEGEEVVTVAGSWVGLDTALVVRATNSTSFLKKGAFAVKEVICKPRNPAHSWPVDQKDWIGDLQPYKKFAK